VRGRRQEAYQIIIWTNENGVKRIVWDSGRVASTEVTHQRYQGSRLRSLTTYEWQACSLVQFIPVHSTWSSFLQVRCWDQHGEATEWSEVGRFHMGLLASTQETGDRLVAPQWIGGGSLLRRGNSFNCFSPLSMVSNQWW